MPPNVAFIYRRSNSGHSTQEVRVGAWATALVSSRALLEVDEKLKTLKEQLEREKLLSCTGK